MSSQGTTTTKNGFKVYDVTFKNARRQSEIENEIEKEEHEEVKVTPPVSMTPEQVKDFFKTKIKVVSDSNEKRVYSQTIRWIDELLATKKELTALKEKELARLADEELDISITEDIDKESEVE